MDFLYATRLVEPHCVIAGFHPIFFSISNGGQDELAVCKHEVNFVFYSTYIYTNANLKGN